MIPFVWCIESHFLDGSSHGQEKKGERDARNRDETGRQRTERDREIKTERETDRGEARSPYSLLEGTSLIKVLPHDLITSPKGSMPTYHQTED